MSASEQRCRWTERRRWGAIQQFAGSALYSGFHSWETFRSAKVNDRNVSNPALRDRRCRIEEPTRGGRMQNRRRRDNQRLNFGVPGKFAEVSGFQASLPYFANRWRAKSGKRAFAGEDLAGRRLIGFPDNGVRLFQIGAVSDGTRSSFELPASCPPAPPRTECHCPLNTALHGLMMHPQGATNGKERRVIPIGQMHDRGADQRNTHHHVGLGNHFLPLAGGGVESYRVDGC